MATKHTTGTLHLLTVKQVQFAPEGDHADGGGLLLRMRTERLSKSGTTLPAADSWVFRYTSPSGRRREMGLGVAVRGSPKQAGDSLTGARKTAHDCRELLRQGLDPIDQRDAGKAKKLEAEVARKAEKARQHLTLCRAARDYHERVIEPRLSSKHAAQWISSLENHIPAELWNTPIGSVQAPALLTALSKITPHERARNLTSDRLPETLRRLRQRLDSIFEDAIFHGHCANNPAAAIRRKMRETLPAKKAGEFKALPYKEAPAFLQRLRQAEGTAARCLEFAVLCAARTGEVLGAVWSEIDMQQGVWLVPGDRMKSSGKERGEDHVVHLTVRALEILRGQLGQSETIVFPSPMDLARPQSNMAMLATLDRLGVRDQTTVHGLCRATFSTWAYDTAAARPDVIEACLAHKEADKVKAAYNRAQFTDERRALLAAWGDYLAQPPAVVLPFEARAA